MDQYTAIEILEELEEIVKEWLAEVDKIWPLGGEDVSPYSKGHAHGVYVCAGRIEALISRYDQDTPVGERIQPSLKK